MTETRASKGAADVCSVRRGRWANCACGGGGASGSLLGVGGWRGGATFDGYSPNATFRVQGRCEAGRYRRSRIGAVRTDVREILAAVERRLIFSIAGCGVRSAVSLDSMFAKSGSSIMCPSHSLHGPTIWTSTVTLHPFPSCSLVASLHPSPSMAGMRLLSFRNPITRSSGPVGVPGSASTFNPAKVSALESAT